MPDTITDTVLFNINIQVFPVGGGQWVCVAKETGIVSMSDSKEDATRRNAVLHEALVKRLKLKGRETFDRFMEQCGIEAMLDGADNGVVTVTPRPVARNASGEHLQLRFARAA